MCFPQDLAIPSLARDGFVLWTTSNIVSLILFSRSCAMEAYQGTAESNVLRLYWVRNEFFSSLLSPFFYFHGVCVPPVCDGRGLGHRVHGADGSLRLGGPREPLVVHAVHRFLRPLPLPGKKLNKAVWWEFNEENERRI